MPAIASRTWVSGMQWDSALAPPCWAPEGNRQLGCWPACGSEAGRVAGRDDDARLPQLCRLSLPGRGYQACSGTRLWLHLVGLRKETVNLAVGRLADRKQGG